MKPFAKAGVVVWTMLLAASPSVAQQNGGKSDARDIRKLSQNFTDPKDISPWMFVPQDNIKSLSTTEHPGYVTIWEAGKGKDVKGLLPNPIKIDDYPLPWEFHLG